MIDLHGFFGPREARCALTLQGRFPRLVRSYLRGQSGYATVVITRPDGRTRAIFFRMGIPVGADTSQADGHGRYKSGKESDLNLICVGDERYEIPVAVVLGG